MSGRNERVKEKMGRTHFESLSLVLSVVVDVVVVALLSLEACRNQILGDKSWAADLERNVIV